MKLKFQPDDPHLMQTLLALATGAVEGPFANARIQVGIVPVRCAGNAVTSQQVSFKQPFQAGTTPFVVASLCSAIGNVTPPTVTAVNWTYKGFTIQAAPSAAQTIQAVYIAIGQTG